MEQEQVKDVSEWRWLITIEDEFDGKSYICIPNDTNLLLTWLQFLKSKGVVIDRVLVDKIQESRTNPRLLCIPLINPFQKRVKKSNVVKKSTISPYEEEEEEDVEEDECN